MVNCVGLWLWYNKLEQSQTAEIKKQDSFPLPHCSCGLCLYESDPSIPRVPRDPSDASRASVCCANCPTASWKAVDFDVFWQVVAAGKLLLTDRTLVGFDPWVGAPVSGQLIRPGKPGRKKRRRGFRVSHHENHKRHNTWLWLQHWEQMVSLWLWSCDL